MKVQTHFESAFGTGRGDHVQVHSFHTRNSSAQILLLDNGHIPCGTITPKHAMQLLVRDSCWAFDASGERYDCRRWMDFDTDLKLWDSQLTLRSAKREWPVPFVVAIRNYAGRPPRNRPKCVKLTFAQLYSLYDGVCQICFKSLPAEELQARAAGNIDHVHPRSKGGTNHDFNTILSCRPCNTRKGDTWPFYNDRGELVKATRRYHTGFFRPPEYMARKEWKDYLI